MERHLHTLLPGEKGTVTRVHTLHPELKQRLLSMGLVSGTEIECNSIAPLGDPISLLLKGYCLSLRKSEAEAVIIECP
jgi:ferrous iron transport protein A